MCIAQELRSLSPMALRLVVMKFLAYVGMQGAYFVGILGTLTYALGGDPTSASATVGLLNLMFLLGSFSSGSLLDAMGPRRHFHMVVASTALACVLTFLLSDSVVGILVGTSVFGLAWGLADPVLRSYPRLPHVRRGRAQDRQCRHVHGGERGRCGWTARGVGRLAGGPTERYAVLCGRDGAARARAGARVPSGAWRARGLCLGGWRRLWRRGRAERFW